MSIHIVIWYHSFRYRHMSLNIRVYYIYLKPKIMKHFLQYSLITMLKKKSHEKKNFSCSSNDEKVTKKNK